jgi:hypothetical protein
MFKIKGQSILYLSDFLEDMVNYPSGGPDSNISGLMYNLIPFGNSGEFDGIYIQQGTAVFSEREIKFTTPFPSFLDDITRDVNAGYQRQLSMLGKGCTEKQLESNNSYLRLKSQLDQGNGMLERINRGYPRFIELNFSRNAPIPPTITNIKNLANKKNYNHRNHLR